jgi:Flp pilus assembly protein TadD
MLLPILFAVVLAAYRPAWHGQLLWDDDAHVTRSELRSWDGLRRVWFDLGSTQQYYPLVHSVFWLQFKLWEDHPLGYHLLNIGLHALSAFLLALILRRVRVPGALLAAFVFALHPVHVESVAWITELKNTLSGAFYLGAALAYLYFDHGRQRRFYGAALTLFVLALLSKTVTATLPVGLLVLLWWHRGKLNWRRDVVPLTPFFILGAAGGLTTAWVERTFIGAQGADFNLTFIERCLVAGRAVVFYLSKLAWPANLSFMYPRWNVDESLWWQYAYPLAVAGALGASWLARRRSRAPLAALLYFGVTLGPALGFLNVYPFRYSFVADHFQYLASIGIIALAAAALVSLLVHQTGVATVRTETILILALGIPLAVLTRNQSRQYIDAETLYSETLRRNSQCWLCHENLGIIELHRSPSALERAAARFEAALRINPNDAQVHNNLGTTWMQMGRLEAAVQEHTLAVRLAPWYAEAYGNLGADLQQLGRLEEAAEAYRHALRIKPDLTVARTNLAVTLQSLNRSDEADAELSRAANHLAAVRPTSPSADSHATLGSAYVALERFSEGVAQYEAAVRIAPDSSKIRRDLGYALWRAGRLDEAAAQLRTAVRLEPDHAGGHANLATVLGAMNQLEPAVREYREALRLGLKADVAEIHNDLGIALARLGRRDDAVAEFDVALRLKPDYAAARANLSKALAMRR